MLSPELPSIWRTTNGKPLALVEIIFGKDDPSRNSAKLHIVRRGDVRIRKNTFVVSIRGEEMEMRFFCADLRRFFSLYLGKYKFRAISAIDMRVVL